MMGDRELEYKNIAKTILKRYIPAVILIVILMIIKQGIVQYEISHDNDMSGIVNISGRQRMLSQKISKDAYALYVNNDQDKINFYLDELKTSTDTWKNSNIALKTGNINKEKINNSNVIMETFSEIQENHEAMLSASYDIISMIENRSYDKSSLLDKINIIEKNEGDFLDGMDKIVFQYDKEFQDKLNLLKITELILFVINLIIIVFEILFIFMPAEKSLFNAFEEIQESHENMMKLFKMAHEAMFVVDQEELNVLLMNKQAEKLINMKNVELDLIKIEDVIKCKNLEYSSVIEKIKNNEKNNNMEVTINVNENKDIVALISSTKIEFNKKDAILIGLFDITIQKKEEELLKNIAVTDELTGLYNRHYLDKRIKEEIEFSDKYNEHLSIIIFDLDNFKHVNDTWGHPLGDEVLKQAAEIAKSMIRKSDILVRLGGEEFLVLMTNTNTKEAVEVAEKIRKALEDNIHPTIGKFTASFGVAERNKSEGFISLYKRADEALYRAKERGRNCVVSSEAKEESFAFASVQFRWQREWESGNKEIDNQHRELMDISNTIIHMLLLGDEINKISTQLDKFLKHLYMHFAYEEKTMAEAGYEECVNHSKIHKNLAAKAIQFKENYKNGQLKSSEFFSYILDDIVIRHMQNSDMKFFEYMRNK